MTGTEVADEIMTRWGMPPGEEAFRAVIEYVFQQGVIEGVNSAGSAMKRGFSAAERAPP
jgi:hypothetical protein